MDEGHSTSDYSMPWPIEALKESFQEGQKLRLLVQRHRATPSFDVREYKLEDGVQGVLSERFGSHNVRMRKQIGTVLGMRDRPFPARTMPDATVRYKGKIHILEVKSSRTDYARFDNVFDSRPFREYLAKVGDAGKIPWEVEQDLIKLQLFRGLSPQVGSCLFLMIDAYEGPDRSWTEVFSSKRSFLSTMRTNLVKGWADRLLMATRIEPLVAQDTSARLITCLVHH